MVSLTAVTCLVLLAPAATASVTSEPPLTPGHAATAAPAGSHCRLSALLVPSCGVLFGAYAQPVAGQSPQDAYTSLEALSKTHFDLLHFYHQGTELFPTDWEIQLADQPGHPHVLLINWKPEAGHSWAAVASGAADSYIDQEAAYLVSHFTEKFFLVIHHEPENEVNESAGSGYTATDYAAMFRHVETRLRADGVKNAVYVMNYMGAQTYAQQPWYGALWPGDAYVDWVAFDPYSTASMGVQEGGFGHLVNLHWGTGVWRGAYRWAHRYHPTKPVMLAEWGIGEKPDAPEWKSWFFGTIAGAIEARFPDLLALAYFNSGTPETGGDVRVNTSARSLHGWIQLAGESIFHPIG